MARFISSKYLVTNTMPEMVFRCGAPWLMDHLKAEPGPVPRKRVGDAPAEPDVCWLHPSHLCNVGLMSTNPEQLLCCTWLCRLRAGLALRVYGHTAPRQMHLDLMSGCSQCVASNALCSSELAAFCSCSSVIHQEMSFHKSGPVGVSIQNRDCSV